MLKSGAFSSIQKCPVCPTMLHIKKTLGMHNKETYTCIYIRMCARIHICVYTKYAHIIRVRVVCLHLTCPIYRLRCQTNTHCICPQNSRIALESLLYDQLILFTKLNPPLQLIDSAHNPWVQNHSHFRSMQVSKSCLG